MEVDIYVKETFADIEDEFCDIDSVCGLESGEEVVEDDDLEDDFCWPDERREILYPEGLDWDWRKGLQAEGKTVRCEECDYVTSRRANLLRHLRTVHNLVRLQCQECGAHFSDQSSLKRHFASVHQNTPPCVLNLQN